MNNTTVALLSNQQTGYFSKTVTAYLNQEQDLLPFYQHPVSLQGIADAIKARQAFSQQRDVLVNVLQQQYTGLTVASALQQNIQLLLQNNSFTVTTAHQPVIFTGPLYFIYKILHTIKLADHLSQAFPDQHFIPVYYMGSEDADLDELGSITIREKKYTWATKQTGAVGRMKVDKAFISLLQTMEGQLGTDTYGPELIALFKACYREGVTIQQATLEVVNALFGSFGLVVVIPDNAELKSLFHSVIEKELLQQFSHTAVSQTLAELEKNYKVQAGGRDLNLFYLVNDKRERLKKSGELFKVESLGLTFTRAQILDELQQHPERFSANVILRGVFQETILPNVAFIGGGGELAYWLELKKVFEAACVPYPVLVLRNSLLLVNERQHQKALALGFELPDLFKTNQALLNQLVQHSSTLQLNLTQELQQLKEFYQHLKTVSGQVDITLQPHVEALYVRANNKLLELEKKMLRAERRKFTIQQKQVNTLKQQLFPNNSLQERVENLAGFYAIYGQQFIDMLLAHSLTLEQQFAIISLD